MSWTYVFIVHIKKLVEFDPTVGESTEGSFLLQFSGNMGICNTRLEIKSDNGLRYHIKIPTMIEVVDCPKRRPR